MCPQLAGYSLFDRQTHHPMSDLTIEYDELVKMLNRLDTETVDKILLTATKEAADTLRDATKTILLQKLPAAAEGKKYGKPMVKGVISKSDKDYTLSYVSIMREFKLKFFEQGTDNRFRKIRYSGKDKRGRDRKVLRKNNTNAPTGKITALDFFKEARERYADSVVDDMQSAIIKSLERITGGLQ